MRNERGFSLIELTVVIGVVSAVALSGAAVALGSRSLAVSSAAQRFDALLEAARTTAAAYDDGVTLAFVPDAFGDGFRAQLYRSRPGRAPLIASSMPALTARVAVRETEVLGAPAFALTIHGNGSVAGLIGDVRGGAGAEVGCPASGAYHLVFSYGALAVDRHVRCRIELASTAPAALASLPPGLPLPLPTAQCLDASCAVVPTPPPLPVASPVAVAVYFAGPSGVQQNAQPASFPQPCDSFPLYDHNGGASGDASSGGWFEDDWYLETLNTTAAAFVRQHAPSSSTWWTFDGDSFGKPNGVYLDPAQYGAIFRAGGTYGTGTDIGSSALPLSSLQALPPATALLESDYLHESCFAAWSSSAGGG